MGTVLTASEIVARVTSGEQSARDVLDEYLGRVKASNGVLNAICTLTQEEAREEAEAVDRRLRAGNTPRPLEGVPFVAKDVLSTKGVLTTHGSRAFASNTPDEDAIVVERMRGAGAILLGKTNTSEFASAPHTGNEVFGTTRNPWDVNRTPGGSSGGTAAAIAGGMAPVGLGTDLGGSARAPAALCGVVGMRPTPGRVPAFSRELAWGLLVENVHAPMAGTVGDIGLLLDVIAGPDDRSPSTMPLEEGNFASAAEGTTDLTGRRVAFTTDMDGQIPADETVAKIVTTAAKRFSALGCDVVEASPDISHLKTIIASSRGFGLIAQFSELVEFHQDHLTPELVQQISRASALDLSRVTGGERLRSSYYHRFRELFESYDYLVTPTLGVTAFRLDDPLPTVVGGADVEDIYDAFLFTYAMSVAGLPAISFPAGLDDQGLPVGIQVVSMRLREAAVLEAASSYQRAFPFRHSPPPLAEREEVADVISDGSPPSAWSR